MASSTAVRGCDRFGLSPTHPDILLGNASGSGLSWEELDGARAERLCRAALEEFPNHPRLLSSLGRGLNKQSSYSAALSAYRDSAQAGDIVAMHNLGVMYQIGQAVAESQMTAAMWYQKSADLGYAHSQFNLGLLFALGNGVSKDPRRAAEWYLRAAKQGHADAQVWVGHNFQYGQGSAIDPLEAARWYAQAQSNGSDTGKNRLRLLLQDKPTARQVQQKLKDMGHYTARVDGSFGRGSYHALKKYCQCRF
jgi:TPR repeat protein